MQEQRLIIADSDATWRKHIKFILAKVGFIIIGEAEDGLTALKLIRSRQPDLVVMDAFLPGMNGYDVARIVSEDKLAPVILLASPTQQNLLDRAKAAKVFALLMKSDADINLISAAELALVNFKEIVKLENQVKELQETLETRKAIEKAKGILMESLGISESEAFKRIQRQSMNKRVSMRAVAEALIMAHSV